MPAPGSSFKSYEHSSCSCVDAVDVHDGPLPSVVCWDRTWSPTRETQNDVGWSALCDGTRTHYMRVIAIPRQKSRTSCSARCFRKLRR